MKDRLLEWMNKARQEYPREGNVFFGARRGREVHWQTRGTLDNWFDDTDPEFTYDIGLIDIISARRIAVRFLQLRGQHPYK